MKRCTDKNRTLIRSKLAMNPSSTDKYNTKMIVFQIDDLNQFAFI